MTLVIWSKYLELQFIFVLFKWVSKRRVLSLPVFVHLKCSTLHLEQDNEQTREGAKANVPEMNDRWKVIYKMNNEWGHPFCLLSFPFTFSGNSFSFPSTKEKSTSQVLHNSILTFPEKWCPRYTDCLTALELVNTVYLYVGVICLHARLVHQVPLEARRGHRILAIGSWTVVRCQPLRAGNQTQVLSRSSQCS